MDHALFEHYRREHRALPLAGFDFEASPAFSRYTAHDPTAEGFIVFAELPPTREEELIDEQVRHFAARRQRFEWKIHELDTPADLKARLEQRGFIAGDVEALLVLPLDAWTRSPLLPAGVSIARVTDLAGIRDFAAVQQATWPSDLSWLVERYAVELRETPDSIAVYCAYCDGRPVASGRVDFSDSSFAYLKAGAVVPGFRGRGIFSAMVDCRVRDARTRGYRFAAVDAAPMSRPILLRQGFQHVCFTYPMRLPA